MHAAVRISGLAGLVLCCAARGADVSPAQLAQCAGIATSEARLACYDALAQRVAGTAATRPFATAPASNALPVAKPKAPAAAVAPVPEAVSLDDPKNFGLSLNQLQRGQSKAPTAELKSITAHITGVAPGATGHARIVLDNDQTWDVLDDDGGLKSGLEVSIRKATLGSFLMSASHHLYRVHRAH
jgi:hypothetical protein